MNPYDYDGEDSQESGDDWGGEELEDRAVLSRSRQSLGLTRYYVPSWKPPHAIREFYQNWKDAIIEAAGLEQKSFEPVAKGFDSKGVYVIESRHPDTSKLLGFIRYKNGTLEFTNFNARLSRKCLDLGVTTKRDNNETAGTHGEGFKVGALVMARCGYRVQIQASDYYWNMKLGGKDSSTLYCHLNPMSVEKLAKLRKKSDTRPSHLNRLLVNNIWEDVSFKIGGRVRGSGGLISKADFEKWMHVSIDLQRPNEMIHTIQGSLILDPAFGGKIYLKGLLLEANSSSKRFTYGYNLLRGEVNRDRERLSNPFEEAKELAEIWAHAIELNKENTIGKYVAMLRSDEAADVHEVERFISESVAKTIWQHLLKLDPEKRLFYHDSRTGDKDVEVIINSLKKEPQQLPKSVWEPLRRFDLIRTPEEQQFHLLHSAPASQMLETPYSLGLRRALKAALALNENTRGMTVTFKSGSGTNLDLVLEGSDLEINDKWLSFDRSHRASPCWLSRQHVTSSSATNSQPFSCDHITSNLYWLVLQETVRRSDLKSRKSFQLCSILHQNVCEKLRQAPVMVTAEPGDLPGEIEVGWFDKEGSMISRMYGLYPECQITLHRASRCAKRREELITSSSPSMMIAGGAGGAETAEIQECSCPTRTVSPKDVTAIFGGLDVDEHYFPMVSRTDPQSFFALPPRNVRPRDPMRLPSASPSQACRSGRYPEARLGSILVASPSSFPDDEKIGFDQDYGNLYDEESSDEMPTNRANSSRVSATRNDDASVRNNARSRRESSSSSSSTSSADQITTTIGNQETDSDCGHELLAIREETIRVLKVKVVDLEERIRQKNIHILKAAEQERIGNDRVTLLEGNLKNYHAEMETKLQRAKLTEDLLQQDLIENQQQTSILRADFRDLEQNLQVLKAESEKANSLAEAELQSRQTELDNLKTAAEDYEARELDASGTIENLRLKIQQLQADVEELSTKLEQCEDAYDEQVALAKKTAERRRQRPKRERADSIASEALSGANKRVRAVIKTENLPIIDLTDE